MFHVCCLPDDPLPGRLDAAFIERVYHPRDDRRFFLARGIPFRACPDLVILGADGGRPLWRCDPAADPEVLERWRRVRQLCDDRSSHPYVVSFRLRPHPLDADLYAAIVAVCDAGIPVHVSMDEERRGARLHPAMDDEIIRRWPHAAWEEVMGVHSTSAAGSSSETRGEEDAPSSSEPESDDSWMTDENS